MRNPESDQRRPLPSLVNRPRHPERSLAGCSVQTVGVRTLNEKRWAPTYHAIVDNASQQQLEGGVAIGGC